MATVYNPNVARVDLLHLWDSQEVENTLYFFSTTEPNQAALQDLADGVRLYWQTNMLPLMSSEVAFLLAEVTKLEPVPAEFASAPAALPNIGGNGGAALPNSVSIAVSFRTGLTGRSYRGRNYWLGLTETTVQDNEITSAHAAAIVAAYAGMMGSNVVTDFWTWGVYSQRTNNAPRETGLFQDITSVAIVDYTIDSQRRRLPGRGR